MKQPDVREEAVIARRLLLLVQDAYALSRSMELDYGAIVKDCSRKRYHYWVDKALIALKQLLVFTPSEVQRVADRAGSTVTSRFLTDLSIALSKEQTEAEFFRQQQKKMEKRITELRLQALEEAVFGKEDAAGRRTGI